MYQVNFFFFIFFILNFIFFSQLRTRGITAKHVITPFSLLGTLPMKNTNHTHWCPPGINTRAILFSVYMTSPFIVIHMISDWICQQNCNKTAKIQQIFPSPPNTGFYLRKTSVRNINNVINDFNEIFVVNCIQRKPCKY